MESENSMTMQQAQEKMKVYEEVFDIVRLLDEDSIGKIKKQDVNDFLKKNSKLFVWTDELICMCFHRDKT